MNEQHVCLLSPFLFNIVPEVLPGQLGKEIKQKAPDWKERSKTISTLIYFFHQYLFSMLGRN